MFGHLCLLDLNGDGIPDLVVPAYSNGNVAVLIGNGDGTFKTPVTHAVGSSAVPFPYTVVAADVNGDGHPDLIAVNYSDNSVGVLLNNGSEHFAGQQTFAVGGHPRSVAVADLGNGHPDLVVGNTSSSSVSVLIGNGNGTFTSQTTIAVGRSTPREVVVANVNSDSFPDLVVANAGDNTVGVLLGNGNGTFRAEQTIAIVLGGANVPLAVGDVNGDGKADLVVADYFHNAVAVLLGNNNGTFTAPVTYAAGAGPIAVVLADVNHDGNLDIGVADSGGSDVGFLLGTGNGTFAAAHDFAAGTSPRSSPLPTSTTTASATWRW